MNGPLVCRMAHRTTGCSGGEHSEVTKNLKSLGFGDSRKPPEYGRVFLKHRKNISPLLPRLRAGSQAEQQGTDGETTCSLCVRVAAGVRSCVSVDNVFWRSDVEEERFLARHGQCWKMRLLPLSHILPMSEVLQKHIRTCLSRTFFDGSDFEEKKLGNALAWHAECWEEDEFDPSAAAVGVKKALAPRSEITALGRVGAVWSSLETHFELNVSIERVFRHFRDRFRSGPAHIITAELVAGLNLPELKTKVATALDMKGSWKEHPDLVYSVERETAEGWETVEQTIKLRHVQSRTKGIVARMGSAKDIKRAVVGRGGQWSSARSGD